MKNCKLAWDVSLSRPYDDVTLEPTKIDYQNNRLGFTPRVYDQDTHITVIKFDGLPPAPDGQRWRLFMEPLYIPNYSSNVLQKFTKVMVNDEDKEILIIVSDGEGNPDPAKVGFGPLVLRPVFRLEFPKNA